MIWQSLRFMFHALSAKHGSVFGRKIFFVNRIYCAFEIIVIISILDSHENTRGGLKNSDRKMPIVNSWNYMCFTTFAVILHESALWLSYAHTLRTNCAKTRRKPPNLCVRYLFFMMVKPYTKLKFWFESFRFVCRLFNSKWTSDHTDGRQECYYYVDSTSWFAAGIMMFHTHVHTNTEAQHFCDRCWASTALHPNYLAVPYYKQMAPSQKLMF